MVDHLNVSYLYKKRGVFYFSNIVKEYKILMEIILGFQVQSLIIIRQ